MTTNIDYLAVQETIKTKAYELGFDAVGFSDINLQEHEEHLNNWLTKQYQGEMEYMQKHGNKRSRPDSLVEGTLSVISVRMDYLPEKHGASEAILENADLAYISRYALGRDYHKLMRNRLQKLAVEVKNIVGEFGYRVFTDSAPVLEKALAEKAGLGWIGKHSNLIQEKTGSWFFLGEIFTTLALPSSQKATNHCGSCQKCIDICPTKAIVAPYQVDARRCISYLTIELKTSIPEEFREDIGNRIYGCDDCQLVCPWNKFAQLTKETDFMPRHQLDQQNLITLFAWDEETFLEKTEGSAIRRIGHERWLRNIAIALGNSSPSHETVQILENKKVSCSEMLAEHIDWAIKQQQSKLSA